VDFKRPIMGVSRPAWLSAEKLAASAANAQARQPFVEVIVLFLKREQDEQCDYPYDREAA
jgi:hypothetical protein